MQQAAPDARLAGDQVELRGHVDGIRDGILHGWAARSDSLFAPMRIDIQIGGVVVAAGVVADILRADLISARIGDGCHGFEVPVDAKAVKVGETIAVLEADTTAVVAERVWEGEALADTPSAMTDVAAGTYLGRIEGVGGYELTGWTVLSGATDSVYKVEILVDGHPFVTLRNDTPRRDLEKSGLSQGSGGFRTALPQALARSGASEVAARLPDGSLLGPVRLTQQARRTLPQVHRAGRELSPVSIIVPIYNAADDLERCIDRVFATTSKPARLILIDDASPDPRIAAILAALPASEHITVLRNEKNLGFTGTINRGIEAAGRDDVVLLNSDARVTPRWLDAMWNAAYSDPRIGTVTPLSDRAGAFSAPNAGYLNERAAGITEEDYAVAVRRRASGHYPSVPTGNGFCMYVKRACLDEAGLFDAEAFPRGYGEENDFCMRAGRLGWRHVIDDTTYVFHEHNRSFKSEKTELLAAGAKVINTRYPEYRRAIRVFSTGAHVALARYNAARAQEDCAATPCPPKRILYVISTETGGTPQTNLDLMHAISEAFEPWLLVSNGRTMKLSSVATGTPVVVAEHTLEEQVNGTTHHSFEYDAIAAEWLRRYAFDIVHIRHLGWHSLSLPRLAQGAGAALVNSFHDYYTLCPTVKLLDERMVFCGGVCTATAGECKADFWSPDEIPHLKHAWVYQWRAKFDEALADCDAFATTSVFAKERLAAQHDTVAAEDFAVIPHGRDFDRFDVLSRRPERGERLKILVPGNIGKAKGQDVILALLALDTDALLEFHILGNTSITQKHPRLVLHGGYGRGDFASKAYEIGAHVGAVFSIWDETYCHTLTELWSVGLPTMVLEYQTLSERVRESGAGWVFNQHNLPELYAGIVRECFDPEGFALRLDAVAQWQRGLGRYNSTRFMAARYIQLYGAALARSRVARLAFQRPAADEVARQAPAEVVRKPLVAVVAPVPAAGDRRLGIDRSRMQERTRSTPGRDVTFVRMSPLELAAAVRAGAVSAAILERGSVSPQIWQDLGPAVAAGRLRYLLDIEDAPGESAPLPDQPPTPSAAAGHVIEMVSHAAIVTVPSPTVAADISRWTSAVQVLPDRLSRPLWAGSSMPAGGPKPGVIVCLATRLDPQDLALVLPALGVIARREPTLALRIVGPRDLIPGPLPSWASVLTMPAEVEQTRGGAVAWLKEIAADAAFAIAPADASPGRQAPSQALLLECAVLGLPVLASRHPAYADVVASAPFMESVENQPFVWQQAIEAMLAEPRRDLDTDRQLREWAFEAHGLDPTLEEFDRLVASALL